MGLLIQNLRYCKCDPKTKQEMTVPVDATEIKITAKSCFAKLHAVAGLGEKISVRTVTVARLVAVAVLLAVRPQLLC